MMCCTFIKNSLDVDKKRNGDAMNGGEIFLNDHSLKTEEIQIKSEETDEEVLFETVYIKEEEYDEGDASFQYQTDLRHTEDSSSLYDLDHRKQSSAQSTVANNESEECSLKSTSESRSVGNLLKQEVQVFECDECDYKSINKYHLQQHQLRHKNPSEVRMFMCDECDYKSIRKGDLKQHQLKHKHPAEVKMYKCDKCKFITKHKRSLTRHRWSHRDPTEVQVFQCDECDYKSIRKRLLMEHRLRRHKNPSEVRQNQI